MPVEIGDFWPRNLGETAVATPISILRGQASLLGPKTNQLIKAEVLTQANQPNLFSQIFVITVPSLDNYRYELFRVLHPITLYPLTISWQNANINVLTQEQFLAELQKILGSESTKKLLEALLAQIVR